VSTVESIYLGREAGSPLVAVEAVAAIRGVGLAGDRYAEGRGFWRDGRVTRDLTLVEAEVADELIAQDLIADAGDLRRNVVTRGVSLNALLGKTFWLGDVACVGTELCEPCRHLEEVTGAALVRQLVHRGGLRARVLSSGTIALGSVIGFASPVFGQPEPLEPVRG
jgi:MOSC domain-containing protein YiiM